MSAEQNTQTAATETQVEATTTQTAAQDLPQSGDNAAATTENTPPAAPEKAAKGKKTTDTSAANPTTEAPKTEAEGDKTQGEGDAVDYSFKAPDGFAERIGENDAILGIVGDVAKELGFDGAQMENARNLINGVISKMAEANLLQAAPFDLAAEMAKIGTDGEARAESLRTHVASLVQRKEIEPARAEFLNSLTAEAEGVKLLEDYFKNIGVDLGKVADPSKTVLSKEAAQAEWDKILSDEKWGKDYRWMQGLEPRMQELKQVIDG